jgi:hypothetical protein
MALRFDLNIARASRLRATGVALLGLDIASMLLVRAEKAIK